MKFGHYQRRCYSHLEFTFLPQKHNFSKFHVQVNIEAEPTCQSSDTSSLDTCEATISGQDGNNGLSTLPGMYIGKTQYTISYLAKITSNLFFSTSQCN